MSVPTTAVILAGGQGSRFWPISRKRNPKQFLSISSSGESLIQATARRLVPLVGEDNIVIVTNTLHEQQVREQIPYAHLLVEPVGRNTAPAILLAARWVKENRPGHVMISAPADHAVSSEENLRRTLSEVAELAADSPYLVTVGIEPTRPDTAYGYIQRGGEIGDRSFHVKRFFEKPSLERAEQYLDQGGFFWNSGMFGWRPEVFLDTAEEFLPELVQKFRELQPKDSGEFSEEEIAQLFEDIEGVSVDFGVMEHARNTAVVLAHPYGWNDVGSWDAWAEHFSKDSQGNLLHGDCIALEGQGNVVYSESRFVALVGAEDIVVIDAGDALLVCPRSKVQEVRKVVEYLNDEGREDLV